MLELLSGEEPLKYRYDKATGDFERTSVIETAKAVIDGGGDGDTEGQLRRWVDRRLGDSFPVTVEPWRITPVALMAPVTLPVIVEPISWTRSECEGPPKPWIPKSPLSRMETLLTMTFFPLTAEETLSRITPFEMVHFPNFPENPESGPGTKLPHQTPSLPA